MILIALIGMVATALLLASAAVKFGWLGAIHVLFTAIAVGIWSAAAYEVAEDEATEEALNPDERKED